MQPDPEATIAGVAHWFYFIFYECPMKEKWISNNIEYICRGEHIQRADLGENTVTWSQEKKYGWNLSHLVIVYISK